MRKHPWDAWRVSMLIGALMQLGAAIIRMNGDADGQTWLTVMSWTGYLLLGIGFVLAMRKRSELKQQRHASDAAEAKPAEVKSAEADRSSAGL